MSSIIGEIISRTRNQIKSVKQDAFVTDRFLYSLITKHAALLIRRQDSSNKIMRLNSVFQALEFVELEEISTIKAGCACISSTCKIRRTKEKIPVLFEGYFGPLIRGVYSLDGSSDVLPTYQTTYEKMIKQKTFKYNKEKYYWYLDGHLYFPNIDWDAVVIEGLFKENINRYNCDKEDDCLMMQEQTFNVPSFLFAEIEQAVKNDLFGMLNIPDDPQQDNRHIARQ